MTQSSTTAAPAHPAPTAQASDPRLHSPALPLVLGCNTFGWTSDRAQSFAVLDAFTAAGGQHVDTADSYSQWIEGNSGGESETILGEWFAATGRRDEVFLATKVGALDERKGLSRENVEAAVQDSLSRLQTDAIDLYYAHFDDETQTPEQLARTFDGLVRAGAVRHIGISNLSPERQRAWIAAARAEGLTVPAAIQPHYSLAHRGDVEGEDGYGALAREHGLAVFSYFSLAAGLLSGKYRTPDAFAGAPRAHFLGQFGEGQAVELVETLVSIAEAVSARPASVALAWLLAKGVTAPIASARTPEQLDALIAAASVRLSEEQIARLDAASARFA
ncbi:aldo/keto reductase [Brevibacterium album]|uniref:aldo/keto reductase n=1 Tax=Brevibacterium album TaxID=417948 RepID=UPI0004021F7D|nr:aldo/keto reductase [Brevibacterium album]